EPQFRMGPRHLTRGGPLLRDQVGDGGVEQGDGRRTAQRHGLCADQPRRGKHRDAAKLLRRRGRLRAQAGRLRRGRRAVPACAWPERQRPVAHRPRL
ncbi:uncharacterized protein METZ01_LOCUS268385, partial [marine metagenome]